MESWALALIIIGGVLLGLFILQQLFKAYTKSYYKWILTHPSTQCDIDAFVEPTASPIDTVKVWFIHKIQLGNRVASNKAIPLEIYESDHVPGLFVSRKLATKTSGTSYSDFVAAQSQKPIVVATIRMGFGHHRLAYSAASWALQTGRPTIFHDLLSIESDESKLIKSTDEAYSRFSRFATEIGGPIEKLWGKAMMQGDADALRCAANVAAHLQPLLLDLPKDTCLITTHQLVALTAAAAGFTNVINLVVDNWPQWFLTVPKTINIVQGPVNYQNFLKMGVSSKELLHAGHWCPFDLVNNIDTDCPKRIERAKAKRPIRFLIPVGGAGAQKKFILTLLRALADFVKGNAVQIFLNAGDHKHMKQAFLEILDQCGMDFEVINTTQGVRDFQERLLTAKNEPKKAVTLFAFDEYFPAVATTDILCRVSDVLCCKPSELAFYCLPKLHIRRVGDHEAASAKRSSELGDGTEEAREIEDAIRFLELMLESPDLLTSMNESIMSNNKIGVYNGCKKAVELVTA